jgi:hypothetical protein
MLSHALKRLAGVSGGPQWISVNVSPLELIDADYNSSLEHWLSVYLESVGAAGA